MKLKSTMFYDPEPDISLESIKMKSVEYSRTVNQHAEWKKRQVKPDVAVGILYSKTVVVHPGFESEEEAIKALRYYNENRLRYDGFEIKEADNGILVEHGGHWVYFYNTGWVTASYKQAQLTGKNISTQLYELFCAENGIELKIIEG